MTMCFLFPMLPKAKGADRKFFCPRKNPEYFGRISTFSLKMHAFNLNIEMLQADL